MHRQSPGGSCEEGANCVALCSERQLYHHSNTFVFADVRSTVASVVFHFVGFDLVCLLVFVFLFFTIVTVSSKKNSSQPSFMS